jgi:hypothetical protein
MRPRIEQNEAKFLLELLEKDKQYYEQLAAQLDEKMKPLKITVNQACWYVNNYNITIAQQKYNYPEGVKELCQLEAEAIQSLRKIIVYKKLIAKYTQIAEGKKGRGRYSYEAQNIDGSITGLKDKIFLGFKDYKTPLQVEAPKI